MEEVKGLQAKKIAFIGGGAMAEAIIKGILGGGLIAASDIYVGNRTQKRCDYLNATYGVQAMTDNQAAVAEADLVIFAVKPQVAPVALTPELMAHVKPNAWVLSIMGSVSIEQLHAYAPGLPVVRTMPNTPLAVGAGMTAICCDEAVTESMRADAAAIFSSCGEIEFVDEKAIEAITAISGYDPDRLTVMHTLQDGTDRYDFVWASAGETGERLGRAVVLDDGNYHYCMSVLRDAENTKMSQVVWSDVFDSFCLA